MTGDQSLRLEAAGTAGGDLSRITSDIDALGLHLNDEDIIRNEHVGPYHEFDRCSESRSTTR